MCCEKSVSELSLMFFFGGFLKHIYRYMNNTGAEYCDIIIRMTVAIVSPYKFHMI